LLKLSLIVIVISIGAHAGDFIWQAAPSNNVWSTTDQNWNTADAWPAGAGHTAIFGASAEQEVSVGEAISVGAIRFQSDGYRIYGEPLTFTGVSPSISVESASVTSLLETAIFNDSTLSKTGPGVLRLGAADYNGTTNVHNVAVAEGALHVEDGRTLCSTGVLSVAAGAAYVQTGGTNLLLNGGGVLVLGDGDEAQPASFEITGGICHATSSAYSAPYWGHSKIIAGRDQDAWFRIAGDGSVRASIFDMTELAEGRSSTLQLDGGRLTVLRATGSGGANNTTSRILLNGGEICALDSNSGFISGMTEALMQAGGLTVNVPGANRFYKTPQSIAHDPELGATLDGGLTKIGTGNLHLLADSSYTGTNRIEQGKLFVAATNALGTGPVEVGRAGDSAVLVGDGNGNNMFVTLTNTVTFGANGSVATADGGTLELQNIAFDADCEQINVGGHANVGTGAVRLALDPATTSRVSYVFVFDQNNLDVLGDTVMAQSDPLSAVSGTPRVEVRYGSRLRVADNAVLDVPGLYLNITGGEYRQEGGTAAFRFVHGTTNSLNKVAPEAPAKIVLDGGNLSFADSSMFTSLGLRSTETIINGGHLKAKRVNFSKSFVERQNPLLTHTLELNGGVLEADEIRYDGGTSSVEPAFVRFNGGTLKVAQTSTATNNFVSVNGVDLLSLYIGPNGFVCDTDGQNTVIRKALSADPALGNAADGGVRKLGEGCLTLTQPLAASGPVTVEQGTLRLAEAWFAGDTINVQDGGTLELFGGGISNTVINVAAGGTLRLAEASPETEILNGSFEVYDPPTLTTYRYNPTGTGWTFSGSNTSGLQANGSFFSNDPIYHTTNGTVTALVKQGTIQREFTVVRSGNYRLSFEQATRNGYNSWLRNVDVKIDGATVYTITHNAGELHGFLPEEVMLILTAGTHTLAFEGLPCPNSNATVLIDAVRLTACPLPLDLDGSLPAGSYRVVEAETSVAVTNGSFEIYASNTFASLGHNYAPRETGWTFSGNYTSGIQTNGSAFSEDPEYYTTDGGVTALIREGSIQTTFEVARAGNYLLTFEQATRNGYYSWERNVEVRVDGVTVYTITHNGYHSFLPVEVPVTLTRGVHTLEFVGLYAASDNGAATVLIDAVGLKRINLARPEEPSVLNLSTGSMVILENDTSLYLEHIYVDGVRLYGALRAGMSGGATVLGSGRILTTSGGTMIWVR
jgi:autotransporter-associated beta strand protein